MQFPVSRIRKPRGASLVAFGSAVLVSAVLGMGSSQARAAEPPSTPQTAPAAADITLPQPSGPFAERFPNVVLKTHEGRNVRFYDDLLKGKIVLINFFYATCSER